MINESLIITVLKFVKKLILVFVNLLFFLLQHFCKQNKEVIRIGRFFVQTPLGTPLGIGAQPRYGAAGDLCVKNVKIQ